jgi:uncharacterized protein YjhX (UPF0386 family)
VKPVDLTVIEATAALRYLRAAREGIHVDMLKLEEKVVTIGNGYTREAVLLLDAELKILDDIIRKLWLSMT